VYRARRFRIANLCWAERLNLIFGENAITPNPQKPRCFIHIAVQRVSSTEKVQEEGIKGKSFIVTIGCQDGCPTDSIFDLKEWKVG